MNTKTTCILALLFTFYTLEAQQTLNETIMHDGIEREYTMYIPAVYDGSTVVPLLFNFHGGGGDIASQMWTSDMRPIADTAGFIIVYPQALPDPNDGGTTLWTHKPPTDVDDIFFVGAMIDQIAAEYSIDEERVYACGYSNGGEFTFELACRLSDRIAAIGVVARSMFIDTYENCAPTHPTAVMTIHGTEDDYDGITWAGVTYYIALDEVNNYWSNFNHTNTSPTITQLPNTNTGDGSTVEHHSWDDGDGCVSVEHFKVINGGHDWPGTFGNMDINSNQEIWNFVSRYNREGLIGCATSLNEEIVDKEAILIHPNPVTDFATIEMEGIEEQAYQVYTKFGVLVMMGKIDSNNTAVDVSNLSPGIYFLKIENSITKLIKLQ